MKAIKLFSTLILMAIAPALFAGQPPVIHSPFNPFGHKKISSFSSHSKQLNRSVTYQPLLEIDSSYNGNGTWSLADSVVYQYTSGCLDSIATTYMGGKPTDRELFNYVNGNISGYIYQVKNGAVWQNEEWYIISPQLTPCSDNYTFIAEWNGGAWDTVEGYKETVITNSQGNPAEALDSSLELGEWTLNSKEYFFYDSMDTLRGINYIQYNNAGQVDTLEIDTNFKWIGSLVTSSTFCGFVSGNSGNPPFSYTETFVYDSALATYLKSSEYYYHLNPYSFYEVDWAWNGTGYDTASTEYSLYDTQDNPVYDIDITYDTVAPFQTIIYQDSAQYIYGTNGAIIWEEYWNLECSPNFDTLYPCEISVFSHFTDCSTAGIQAVAATNGNMLVYPNPASDNFTIVLPVQVRGATVEIYNSLGQRVKNINSFSDSKLNISTAGYSAGVYYVRVISETINNTVKIVIE